MARCDVLIRLMETDGQGVPQRGRTLAGQLAEASGVRAARVLGRGGGRLLHVDLEPGVLPPSGLADWLRRRGWLGRLAAL